MFAPRERNPGDAASRRSFFVAEDEERNKEERVRTGVENGMLVCMLEDKGRRGIGRGGGGDGSGGGGGGLAGAKADAFPGFINPTHS